MTASVSGRQQRTVLALTRLTDRLGYPPTVREIAEELGVAVSAAHRSLERLRRAGIVVWQPGHNRTLRVCEDDDEAFDRGHDHSDQHIV